MRWIFDQESINWDELSNFQNQERAIVIGLVDEA